MPVLARVDPEIGAATLRSHLDKYWCNRGLAGRGWTRTDVDLLHIAIAIPARRSDDTVDEYYVTLGADYYDMHPPTVLFVEPADGWPRARAGSRWWPRIANLPWFQLHDVYNDSFPTQVACFSFTAEYYITGHSPEPTQEWRQGKHTVAATLSRLSEVLSPPHYLGRGDD